MSGYVDYPYELIAIDANDNNVSSVNSSDRGLRYLLKPNTLLPSRHCLFR